MAIGAAVGAQHASSVHFFVESNRASKDPQKQESAVYAVCALSDWSLGLRLRPSQEHTPAVRLTSLDAHEQRPMQRGRDGQQGLTRRSSSTLTTATRDPAAETASTSAALPGLIGGGSPGAGKDVGVVDVPAVTDTNPTTAEVAEQRAALSVGSEVHVGNDPLTLDVRQNEDRAEHASVAHDVLLIEEGTLGRVLRYIEDELQNPTLGPMMELPMAIPDPDPVIEATESD